MIKTGSQPQHTPTPLNPSGTWVIIEGNACQSTMHHDPIAKHAEHRYDAVFPLHPDIVLAVNAYEKDQEIKKELYSALKNLVAELDKQFPDSIREPLRSLVVKADIAIAKAEGK